VSEGERVGFVGLGVMGRPMALNLVQAGTPLLVWNRSPEAAETLRAAGAEVASSVTGVFDRCEVVLLMLANGSVVDSVLGRRPDGFDVPVEGRTVVHMGTTPPAYSAGLAADVERAGGAYVEAPVSGSRVPAETGQLVTMLAGGEEVERVRALLAPTYRQSVVCGPVPAATSMKLSANLFLIALVTALAEAVNFAEHQGIDFATLREVLDTGQMASPISRVKLAKLAADDFSVQAGLSDVLYNNELVAQAARASGAATPLLDACHQLFAEAEALGHGGLDMIGVIHALAARSRSGDA
jgi:3-hydroxyisobutyrate dehydrogenase